MKKVFKLFLYAGSLLPAIWTISISISAYFYIHEFSLDTIFIWAWVLYIYGGGLILWISLLLLLKWLKKISWKEVVMHISLAGAGILLGYLALHFDLFYVCSRYLDGSPP